MAAGLFLARRIVPGGDYVTDVLPSILLFAVGLVHTVAPLTITVLAATDQRHIGVASGVNNAVARAASLVAVAVLPPLAGLGGGVLPQEAALTDGFSKAATISAVVTAVGGVVAWFTVPMRMPVEVKALGEEHHCAVSGPPHRPATERYGCKEEGAAA
jgi:hypothetical protein